MLARARRRAADLGRDDIEFTEADIEAVPTTISDAIRACAVGARPLDGDVLVVLDTDLVLTVAT